MLYISIGLFLLAGLFGIYLLLYILQNKNTPKGVAFTHGTIAATALIILIIYAILNQPRPLISILLFILAAMGGVLLIYRDITGKSLPKWMALGHGLIALTALGCLIFFAIAN